MRTHRQTHRQTESQRSSYPHVLNYFVPFTELASLVPPTPQGITDKHLASVVETVGVSGRAVIVCK